ncbi:GMC family oxidoreductase [Phyllobacterium sophorae]|uniref:GMC family oxidoreductase n=2 Tax=Phyllobacterium sophorae TaxID=1520277 RepID=A0A2P7BFA2_9HYPH|nr:GMC family oxidoreductase [Phyllobacterium sophorae]
MPTGLAFAFICLLFWGLNTMFIDARGVPSDSILDTEICIVGGGVAGITLALEFERKGIETCVVEGGGLHFNSASQSLYEGDNVGIDYDLQASRTRQLGGSSNCWGGWIRPFIGIDFEERDWVPNSGWPFKLTEVEPFYRRASELVQVNHHNFEPQFWHEHLSGHHAQLLELNGAALETVVSKFSPPTRFGYAYHKHLAAAATTKVLLNANAIEIATSDDAATATGVHVATSAHKTFFVRAKRTILAAGGIENARLMLLSHKVDQRGLGNEHDVVGRYFMEHPRIRIGQMVPSGNAAAFRFYDARYTYHNRKLAVDGTSASAHVGLAEHLQRQEKLVQCRTYFRACRPGEDGEVTERFHALYNAIRSRHYQDLKLRTFATVARGSPNLMASLLYRRLKLAAKSDYFQIESVVEPVPDRESRVTLSPQRDRLGLNRAALNWRVGDLEKRTHLRMLGLIKEQIEDSGMGRIDLEEADAGRRLSIIGCNHHMGTTRMHADPRLGVVDQNCKVHNMHNLHIAGSSVFATGGNDMPTLTIVALALRLAEHVKAERDFGESITTSLSRKSTRQQAMT